MTSRTSVRGSAVVPALVLAGALVAPAAERVGPEPVLLWPDGAPGAKGTEPADRPELRIYPAPKDRATGTGVVICPGGGYGALATEHEGHQVARWFNSIGVTAAVLKYRLGPRYRHPAPLQDAQRAVRYLRANADKLGLSPKRIGIMGFSAGGHLASTAATHFAPARPDSADPLERVGSRPDFAVLCYPVISLSEPFAHAGSRRNLLGDNPDPALVEDLSNEKRVTAQTPPTFLFHTGEDTGVPAENSLAFYLALRKAKVPAELHVYQRGPHGVGLAVGEPALGGWKDRLADWLRSAGLLADCQRAAVEGTVTVDGQPLRWGSVTFLPAGSERLPAAWALVHQGRFRIPAESGAVVGRCRVLVHGLGAVEPVPTREDAVLLTGRGADLAVEVRPGKNEVRLDVTAGK